MSYLHQDASRAQFEIDQSYVLLISQAEGLSHPGGVDKKKHYNETLVREFQEKVVQKPTIDDREANEADASTLQVVSKIFHGKKEGLYIHCCYFAEDSVATASHLHVVYGWNALVMEGELDKYKTLILQQHSFSLANVVLSSQINFTTASLGKKLQQTIHNIAGQTNNNDLKTETQDFPLGFVARSFERTSVDWLDLSARGRQFGILKALLEGDSSAHVISIDLSTDREAIEGLLLGSGYTKWGVEAAKGIFYDEERIKKSERHDMSPLLEKLRQDKMNRIKVP